jgi:TonB family protein
MRTRIAFALTLSVLIVTSISAAGPPSEQSTNLSAYPNSTDGLQKLVWDMLAAQKSGGDEALAPYLQSLAVPNSAAWFSTAFGQENGAQLAIFYDAWTSARNFQIAGDLARAAASQMTDITALIFDHPGDSGATDKDNYFLGLLKQSQTLYVVNFSSANGASMRWAYFVYVDGAFRYLGPLADLRLMSSLGAVGPSSSTELIRRVRVPSNMEEARVTHRVLPVYPPEAMAARLEGSVDVHTIIAPNGTVQSVDATSGNPVLVSAAEAAVRQWKFDPLLLEGQPVTVDTTITINFHLPPSAEVQPGSSAPYAPIPSYPESSGGLTKMMKQMLDISQHGKAEDLQPFFHALLIPNPDSWFPSQFGDPQGAQFAQEYQQVQQYIASVFKQTLQTDTGLKYDTVEVRRFRDSCDSSANELEYPVLASRAERTIPLYEVRFIKGTSYRWLFPFAYIDGGFRYLGNLQIKQPDNRVYGQDIQWPKLIHEVPPIYPMAFNATRPNNSDVVKLWGTIAADGSVSSLHVIQGTCAYVEATINAVKKWKFTPLMVDGKAQSTTYPFQYSYGPGQ